MRVHESVNTRHSFAAPLFTNLKELGDKATYKVESVVCSTQKVAAAGLALGRLVGIISTVLH